MLIPSLLLLLSASPDTLAKTADGKDVVCRYEKQTNSRFTKRVCRLKAAMEARSLNDADMLRTSQSAASQCTMGATPNSVGC